MKYSEFFIRRSYGETIATKTHVIKLQTMHLIFQLCTQHIQKKIDLDFIEETSDIGLFLFACEDLFYFS